ncbi:MAG: carbonate dehydratase [Myxococcales bacterium SG8_38_1]|jgi:carbonic anhydrase|nr:MAG: carbonate dehydratase [Myxococcales bacterium SG8_38_1]
MPNYKEVFENNRKWVEEHTARDADFFSRLADRQDPDFLFIGCSDSRVPPNEIMGLDPGNVFVHRNVANLIVNTDINAQSVVEYAVGQLAVKHVVVCGHYGCGGVKAAMQAADLGILNGWLREIRDVYRLYQGELDAIADEETRYRRLIELNVQEQCINVIKTAVVQKTYLSGGYPKVHGWVYDVGSGLLRDLELPFESILAKIQEIYDLGAP